LLAPDAALIFHHGRVKKNPGKPLCGSPARRPQLPRRSVLTTGVKALANTTGIVFVNLHFWI
jgi:hypothetical protein